MTSTIQPAFEFAHTTPLLSNEAQYHQDLVAMTAVHELREPVQAIMSFLGVLLEERAGELTELQRDFLATANQATHRLNRRIDDLQLIITESSDVTIRPECTDLATRVSNCCRELSLVAASYGVQVKCSTESLRGPATIWADPDRVDQILLNVIENAIQYAVRGSVVCVAVAPGLSSTWLVTVENATPDDICEDPNTWFESRRRGTCGMETRKSGQGIGLAAASKLAKAQSARISARACHRTVTVSVTFPRSGETVEH
jgi:signal transduction histidine kinase